MNKVIVMESSAKMPISCYGARNYLKIAVVETDGVHVPKQIHPRHKSVIKIVRVWDRVYQGKSAACAAASARRDAVALASYLNGKRGYSGIVASANFSL